MNSSRSPRIDWESLLVRLEVAAIRLFKQFGLTDMLKGVGDSPEDCAANAVVEFFEGKKVNWRPKSPDDDPFPLILTVMRNNLIDRVRSASHQTTTLVEDISGEDGHHELGSLTTVNRQLHDLLNRPPEFGFSETEARILAESFYPFAEGNQQLADVIDAVVYCKCRKRGDIAEWLGISPQEVTDRWEKLRYNYTRRR